MDADLEDVQLKFGYSGKWVHRDSYNYFLMHYKS